MRRELLKSLLGIVVVGAGGCVNISRRGFPAAAFAAFVEEQRAAAGVPGLSVGVANRAGPITVAQSGVRNLDSGEPLRADDVFHVGSITKSMTATLISCLVERGELRWDMTPAELWSDENMDRQFATITLESMLRHCAGFQPLESDDEIANVPTFEGDAQAQRAAFARWVMRQPPFSAIGQLYSNGGYGFAAAMAERSTKLSWEALMRTEVFGPLRMKSAGVGWPPADGTLGHYFSDGRFRPHNIDDGYRLAPFIAPAGDVYACTEDMLTYGLAHMRGPEGGARMLAAEVWKKLHDAPVGGYALGWNIRSFGFHHLGSAGTFLASLIVSPSRDIVVYIAMNGAGFPSSNELISSIASRAFRDFGRT